MNKLFDKTINQKVFDNINLKTNNGLIVPQNFKRTEIDLEIAKKLKDYEKNEIALSDHSYIYVFLSFGLMAFGIYAVFGFTTSQSLFEAAETFHWSHVAVAFVSLFLAVYCMSKGLRVPLDIRWNINSEEYQNMVKVAKYNPEVAQFLKENDDFTKAQYYYRNINEQLSIIANVEGKAMLIEAMKDGGFLGDGTGRISKVEIGKFTPQKTILKNAKRRAIVAVSVFSSLILSFILLNVFDVEISILVRVLYALFTAISFFATILITLHYFGVKEEESTAVEGKYYSALKSLVSYRVENKEYIAQVFKEDRPLNQRDIDTLNIDRQFEALEYDLAKKRNTIN